MSSVLHLNKAYSDVDTFLITYKGEIDSGPFRRVYNIARIGYNPIRLLVASFRILDILVEERPSIVISTGAEIALPALILARALGMKTVFLESASRTRDLSRTGKILLGKVDHFLVQWPRLVERYGKEVEYQGRLL
jgi:UDP-N-acetylglucosamine:LPS N-acetylglucosamine transferase